jgi:hypothetical protein
VKAYELELAVIRDSRGCCCREGWGLFFLGVFSSWRISPYFGVSTCKAHDHDNADKDELPENVPLCRQREADIFSPRNLDVDEFALRRARRIVGCRLGATSRDQAVYSASVGFEGRNSRYQHTVRDALALAQLPVSVTARLLRMEVRESSDLAGCMEKLRTARRSG